MKLGPRHWLVFVLVAVMGAGAFLLWGGGAPPPVAQPVTVADGAASDAAVVAVDELAPVDSSEVHRTTVEVGAVAGESLDEVSRAALAGFVGRVVRADGQPVPGARLELFQFGFDRVMEAAGASWFERTVEPRIEAGAATAGDDGRFHLAGVWPSGFYLLRAGTNTENPSTHPIERCPGPGEVVDLGDLELVDGAVLSGTIVDEGGAPVVGALVRAVDLPAALLRLVPLERFHPDGALIIHEGSARLVFQVPAWGRRLFTKLPVPQTRTGADGSFRLTGLTAGVQSLVATADGFTALHRPGLQLSAGQSRDLGALEIEFGEEVRGEVVDTAGEPVPACEVLIGQTGAAGEVYFCGPALTADARGAFAVTGFASGKVIAAARRAAGDPWVVVDPQPVLRDVRITLPATFDWTIGFASTDGVVALETPPSLRLVPGRSRDGALEQMWFGLTDAVASAQRARLEEGRLVLTALPAGRYTALLHCEGYALAVANVDLRADVETKVQLLPAARLRVVAVGPQDQPLAGVSVLAHFRGGQTSARVGDMPVDLGTTGADGVLVADDLPPVEYRLSARHLAFGWVHHRGTVGADEVRLRFDAPGSIAGVISEAGGVPRERWMVAAMLDKRERGAVPDMPRLTAPNGNGEFEFSGMQPGEYEVVALPSIAGLTTPGAAMQLEDMFDWREHPEAEVTVASGQVARVRLEVGPGLTPASGVAVKGTVSDNGRPGQGLYVTLRGSGRTRVMVDQQGRFDLGLVRPGRLHVGVERADRVHRSILWQQSHEAEAGADLHFDIQLRTVSVEGRVVDPAGVGAGGVHVSMAGSTGSGAERSSARYSTLTDAEGGFSFAQVVAADYRLDARERGGSTSATASLESLRVEAAVHGLTLRLQPTYRVTGVVDVSLLQISDGDQVWGWLQPPDTEQNHEQRHWGTVSRSGQFDFSRVPAGRYTLWVNSFEDGGRPRLLHSVAPLEVGARNHSGYSVQLVESGQ